MYFFDFFESLKIVCINMVALLRQCSKRVANKSQKVFGHHLYDVEVTGEN